MANAIKYSTGSETLALKKGNFYIGTGDVGKGPTSTTGYYNGITPPSGGYTVYLNKASGGPSIYTCANDTQLISLTNSIAGTSYTTANECFVYFAGQTDKMVLNRDYEGIVTDGLIFNLDAGFTPSYPKNGTTWYDLGGTNNGTLTNGPTFNSDNGGSIVFDGVDDYVNCGNQNTLNNMSFQMFVKVLSNNGGYKAFGGAKGTGADYDSGFNIDMQASSTGAFTNCSIEGGFLRVGGGTNFMTSSVPFGTWSNICFTISPTYIQFYLNGIAQYGTARINNTSSTIGMNNLVIGARVYSLPNTSINANISTTQIYDRALSVDEVLQNYNVQKGRFGL